MTNKSWIYGCTLMVLCTQLKAGGWLDRKAQGWAWYEDTKEGRPLSNTNAELVGTAVQTIQKVRGDIEEKLSRAILEPTLENIKAYLTIQKKWLDQSSLFATRWAKVVLNEPSLDQSIHSPTNQFALRIQRQNEQLILDGKIERLGNTHALLFFFDSRSNLSTVAADRVIDFAKRYRWKVIAVSKDGKGIPQFPNPVPDKGIWSHVESSVMPALCTVNPLTDQTWKIGGGILTIEEIKENIAIQHNLKP